MYGEGGVSKPAGGGEGTSLARSQIFWARLLAPPGPQETPPPLPPLLLTCPMAARTAADVAGEKFLKELSKVSKNPLPTSFLACPPPWEKGLAHSCGGVGGFPVGGWGDAPLP